MSDSEESPSILVLVKSVILPFNNEIFAETLRKLRKDVQEASWTSVVYRVEGLSWLLLLVGSILSLPFLDLRGTPWMAIIELLGVHLVIGLAIVAIVFVAQVFLKIVHTIEKGHPVIGDEGDYRYSQLKIVQAGCGLILLSIPILIALRMGSQLKDFLFLFSIFCIVLGSMVAGLVNVISALISLRNPSDT